MHCARGLSVQWEMDKGGLACNLGHEIGWAGARAARDAESLIGPQTCVLARGHSCADPSPSLRAVRDFTRDARFDVCVKGVCEHS